MNKIFRRIVSLLLVSLSMSTLSCGSKYSFPKSTEAELETVLYIGDYEVPFEQYRYFFMNFKSAVDGGDDAYWNDADAAESFASIDADAKSSLRRCYAAFSLADDYGIKYDGRDIARTVDGEVEEYIENEFGGVDAYTSGLTENYMNHSVFRFVLTQFEVESQLYSALVDDGKIRTDGEAVLEAVKNGEFCCAKQVLIKNDVGDDVEENRRLAEQVLGQARIGVDFDELIAQYGEDPEMIVNPMGRYFTRGELIEEFETAAFALEVGGISDVVESPVGFHIILRCEIDDGYVSENLATLGESYVTSVFWRMIDERAETLDVRTASAWDRLTMADFAYDAKTDEK